MVGQSLAIIAVILIMAFMFLRSGRRMVAISVLPLTGVALCHLIGVAANPILSSLDSGVTLRCALYILGVFVSVLLCFLFSKGINGKRARYIYLACCAFFLVALAIAYILYLL